MEFPVPLTPAILLRRYKRFLADMRFADGHEETVHCPNPGAMLGLDTPGSRAWLKPGGGKIGWGWMLAEADGALGGIDPNLPNRFDAGAIAGAADHQRRGYETTGLEAGSGP